MPIYEYKRPDGTKFEVLQSFSDEPLRSDPDTGVAVERVLHPPALHFKGSGFYNTDYGTRKRQRENASSEGSDSKAKDSTTKDPPSAGAKEKDSSSANSSTEAKKDPPKGKASTKQPASASAS
jgi:putative FmdB family regulatory protein